MTAEKSSNAAREQSESRKQNESSAPARKFLFVSDVGLIGDLAYNVKTEGNQVRYFIRSKTDKDISDGFVEKTDDWESLKDWADVIVFDDMGFGAVAERLRKEGKAVVGGTAASDRLEIDRDFGQEHLKKAGLQTVPSWDFSTFDDADKFVKENPGRYVVKPSGKAQEEKVLSFVGQEEDGLDIVAILEHYKKAWSSKIKSFQIQKYVFGVEVAIGAFFNGQDFILPACINFEHKRMFNEEIGPSTGEMGCYDDQTEVLTEEGWKFFRDVSDEDKLCTLNPQSHVIEYQRPTRLVEYEHHKKLIEIKNRAIDIRVTPDHNMYVCTDWNARKRNFNFEFVKAKDLNYTSVIKRTGIWVGQEVAYFILPSIEMHHYEGRQVVAHLTGEIKIPMENWVAFLGIYLADGSVSRSGYSVAIAQKKPARKQLQDLLERLPFNFTESRDLFSCSNKQLHAYLSQFGRAGDKHVPGFVKGLSPRLIRIFLDWFALGDATRMMGGWRVFYTGSEKLANDLQELLLKIGRVGTVKVRHRMGTRTIVDHVARANLPSYEVHERVKKLHSWIDRRDTRVVVYNGKVYCAAVPNHVMYVRRNGKPYFCGNTLMFWSEPNRLYHETLGRFKSILAEMGFVGYFDINCIVNGRGIYPLEITPRFGYPTINVQIEGVTSRWSDMLYALANKQQFQLRTKRGFQIGVVVAVPPYPFADPAAYRRYSEDAVIIFKKPMSDGIHHGDAKLVEDDWRLAGNSGYALVVTGSGPTVEDARKETYNRVRNVIIPNMFYRTDIGERWHRDGDLLQTWGYLD